MSRTERVHFTVEGEFITDTARRLWAEEDEPERAMRILRCMHGITEAQILDVLEGRSKLVGTSDEGIQLVPDTHAGKTMEQLFTKMRAERDQAKEDLADSIQVAIGDTVIVGSPTGAREVPRRRTNKNIHRGRAQLDPDVDFDDLIDVGTRLGKNGEKATKTLRMYKRRDDYGKSWGVTSAKTKSAQEETEREEKEQEAAWEATRARAADALSPTDVITGAVGWLSPEGKFYGCGYAQHAHVAWALGLTDNPQNHSVKPTGWIRLGVNDDRQYFFEDTDNPDGRATEAQKSCIRAWCKESGCAEPWWLKEEDDAD